MTITLIGIMVISENEARKKFIEFIDENDALSREHEIENFWDMAYRLDTWQLWKKCDGHHTDQSRIYRCDNPGLYISIDAPADEPFVAYLGPWELARSNDIEYLYQQMITGLTMVVQFASIHIHQFGVPCHTDCTLCSMVDEEHEIEMGEGE